MAIYDLLDSIGDTATLGRHNNDGLKQVFGINGILDAMDDVRTSVSISPEGKIGRLISKVPQPVRQAFVKIISNPVVQSITFATIAYQFGYSVNEIAQDNHHPLNYYWTASSGIKLASMSIRPIGAGVNFTIKSVSATTKILRGLSVAGKVLGKAAVVTMVADVLITIGVEIHERMEYTKAIAEQVPLLPGNEQAEVFFAGVIKIFTGRDVEKEYEDTIRIKGYLTYVKEAAIKLLNDNYNIAAVVQYVISIEERYSETIKSLGAKPTCFMIFPDAPGCATRMMWTCGLEKKYDNVSFDSAITVSDVKSDLSSLNISETLSMIPYTLDMKGWEEFKCAILFLGIVPFLLYGEKCFQGLGKKEEVYIVNTDVKHIPHLTKYEYENLGLRVVNAPLANPVQNLQCHKIISTIGGGYSPCNTNKIYQECQETFILSGEPFIFTNPKRRESSDIRKATYPKDSILYISGPRTLTAAANYPAVMHIPEGSNIRYIGSKNNETIFVIDNSTSGTLEGGAGKENTVVMSVKANDIVADLHSGTIHYGNSNNIRLVNTYNYISNSDNKQNITTHCETRLINVKNAEIWQNLSNCTDKDYEVRVVNKENIHHRGLKQTIFVVNGNSDTARIVSGLGDTGKVKGNIDVIRVQVANITQWRINENIEESGYNLDLLTDDMQSIVSSTKIDDLNNLSIEVSCDGITESVAIQDKYLSDTVEDMRYQKLKNSGNGISGEVVQNSEKKLKAFIQAGILDQELSDTYQIAKDIASKSNLDIPISQIEVTKSHMEIPTEKVIIANMYSDQVIVDFSYNNPDVTSSYQKYRNNGGNYNYEDYMMLCNYYQDITVEGENRYVIKIPATLNSEVSSSPIRLNLKIKSKAASYQRIPYSIIDFGKLNVTDVDSISIEEGVRSYINECYNKSISDLTEDSLEIKDITILDKKGSIWSLSIGLVDYFQSSENQQIVLQMNNELYKIDSTNLGLEHVEMNPSFFRYYQSDEQGLQIYHNQPINNNDIGVVDFKDKSIVDFDMEIADDSLVLSHKNNTLAKVEGWNTYQPAREVMFAFNDTTISNLKCIVSTCNSEDIIEDFYKGKVDLLKEQVFNATLQRNNSKAEDLIKKIKSIGIGNEHELTPLNMAIQGGRLDVVKVLFDRKDFNVENKYAYPLHLAAQEGKLNIAEFLIDKGYDIKAEDKDSRTPLRIAGCNGNLDVVKFFLSKDATSIEDRKNDPYKMMETVKVLKKEIINQAETAPNVKRWAEFFVEKLKYSVENVVKEKLKDGMLHDRYGSVNTLANDIYNFDQRLFNNTIKGVINDVYGKVDTKKILSCVESHNDVSQRILDYVAVFNAMQRNNDLNNSAIFKLAYSVKEIMSSGNYSSLDSEKRSDLEGLKGKLPKSVKNIVFASKVCIKNTYQNEYLYAAVDCFNYDTERRRAFTWVPGKNDKQSVWKIQPDGDSFRIVNVEFNEHLYAASNYFNCDNDRRMVFTWIPGGQVTQGVWKIEPNGNECNIRNIKHNEYLYAAGYAKYDKDRRRVFTWVPGGKVTQGVWRIEDCGSTVRKGRSQDVGATAQDNNGGALSFNQSLIEPHMCDASENGHFGGNVDVNSTDENGWTPLHLAAWKGQLNDTRSLVRKGADINTENIFGRKPIHVAAENNNTNIIEFFLSKGMSIDDVDRYGRTPLYCASWNGHLGVVKYSSFHKSLDVIG